MDHAKNTGDGTTASKRREFLFLLLVKMCIAAILIWAFAQWAKPNP
jgi:hypothetical protein